MVVWMIVGMATIIVCQRTAELLLAKRNKEWLINHGAREYGAEHYPLFFLLHITWLVGWMIEGSFNHSMPNLWPVWLSIFLLAQVIRYWCITSMGKFWNTRVLVISGGKAVRRGPYRFIKHPNYLAVALELMAVPLLFNAMYSAIIATSLNAVLLLLIRIPVEEQALLLLSSSHKNE